MTEHTPLPWVAKGRQVFETSKHEMSVAYTNAVAGAVSRLGKLERFEISDSEAEANAAYIVKCCNAFPVLVKALETSSLMIKGQMVECAVIDVETMEPLGGMLDRVLRNVKGAPDHG